jgi:NAD(P)-dependent dehydrogenase (short-subunit alcohol dehydrogenase family)
MTRATATGSGAPGRARQRGPAAAALAGIADLFGRGPHLPGLADGERIDGRVCLVTGSNTGLGKAVAVQLAERGGRVIMACRSGIPEAAEAVKRASGSEAVEMMRVDLADLASVQELCDELREREIRLDVAVLNAGVVPRRARRTAQGFELMFGVNFLANRLLLLRWLEDGVIAADAAPPGPRPRIVLVSSEAHRSAPAIDFARFGEFADYGLRDGMAEYGRSKLHLSTLACELSRRLADSGDARVGVYALCPGPINSDIAREAPALVKPLLSAVMGLAFRSPARAAEPVVYLACSQQLEGRTGVYLHMMREKAPAPEADDPENGALLWRKSEELLRPYL